VQLAFLAGDWRNGSDSQGLLPKFLRIEQLNLAKRANANIAGKDGDAIGVRVIWRLASQVHGFREVFHSSELVSLACRVLASSLKSSSFLTKPDVLLRYGSALLLFGGKFSSETTNASYCSQSSFSAL
jgi:hypothetical protein